MRMISEMGRVFDLNCYTTERLVRKKGERMINSTKRLLHLGAVLANCLIRLTVCGSWHMSNGVFPSLFKKLMSDP